MKRPELSSPALWLLLALTTLLSAGKAQAGTLGFGFGVFDLKASSAVRSGHASGFGAYRLSYRHALFDRLELDVGYSLLMSGVIGGDQGFGLDLGMAWFPFSLPESISDGSDRIQLKIRETWRPFVGFGFHQRTIQSTQAVYGGAGVNLGVERSVSPTLSLSGVARYIVFTGPSNSTANELTTLLGISYRLN